MRFLVLCTLFHVTCGELTILVNNLRSIQTNPDTTAVLNKGDEKLFKLAKALRDYNWKLSLSEALSEVRKVQRWYVQSVNDTANEIVSNLPSIPYLRAFTLADEEFDNHYNKWKLQLEQDEKISPFDSQYYAIYKMYNEAQGTMKQPNIMKIGTSSDQASAMNAVNTSEKPTGQSPPFELPPLGSFASFVAAVYVLIAVV